MEAELGGEIGDQELFLGIFGRVDFSEPADFRQMGFEGGVDAIEMGEVAIVGGYIGEAFLADDAEQLDGVVIDLVPELAVEAAEEFDRVGMPDPPEIVRHLQQGLKGRGHVGEYLESF